MALKTPTELAKANGQFYEKLSVPGDTPFKADHGAADVLHGWTLYEKTFGEPVMLEEDDYKAALQASKTGGVHAPACKREPREVDEDGVLGSVKLIKPEAMIAAEEEAKGEASVSVDEEGSN